MHSELYELLTSVDTNLQKNTFSIQFGINISHNRPIF